MAERKTAAAEKQPLELLEETRASVEQLMSEARAEAQRIVDEARAYAAGMGAPAERREVKPAISEERVKIRLFKDNGKYSQDVFVGVNGVGYQIRRGETVEVPLSVAEVLEQSMTQDEATAMTIEKYAQEYEKTK